MKRIHLILAGKGSIVTSSLHRLLPDTKIRWVAICFPMHNLIFLMLNARDRCADDNAVLNNNLSS